MVLNHREKELTGMSDEQLAKRRMGLARGRVNTKRVFDKGSPYLNLGSWKDSPVRKEYDKQISEVTFEFIRRDAGIYGDDTQLIRNGGVG